MNLLSSLKCLKKLQEIGQLLHFYLRKFGLHFDAVDNAAPPLDKPRN